MHVCIYECECIYKHTHTYNIIYILSIYDTKEKLYLYQYLSIYLCLHISLHQKLLLLPGGRISLLEYHDTVTMLCEVFWIHFTNGATEMK